MVVATEIEQAKRSLGARKRFWIVGLGVVMFGVCGAITPARGDSWEAPPEAAQVKNPITSSPDIISQGKAIYKKRCAGCHGDTGKGDGPDAADLSIEPADLGAQDTQHESDGALFWKIQTGKKPMPKYSTRLSPEDIWTVVHFVRTFAGGR